MSRTARPVTESVSEGARGRGLYVSLALVVSLLAALPLLVGRGLVNTRAGGDSPFLVQRVYELSVNLADGVFPARWMPGAAFGLGYPFFNFYASFPYYLASLLNLLGFGVLWGIKLTQTGGFVWAGLACYGLARRLGASRPGALLAATGYTMAPFHLVNVYVRGDALSEFYAFALYPCILWAAIKVVERPSRLHMAGLAISYGLLVLTHNVSAMIFSPLLALWIVAGALIGRGRPAWRGLGVAAASIVLSLLLSAWFWVPALREGNLVQLQDQTTGYFHYAGHFRSGDLVQANLLHDYSVDAERDPFSVGLVQACVALLGTGAAVVRSVRRRRIGGLDVALLAGLVGYTWLITPWSRWVWDHVPLLPYAQFPWRMLSVQGLLAALLAGGVPGLFGRRADRWVSGALVLVLTAAGLGALKVDRLPLTEADVTLERLMLYETYSGNIGSTIRHEYLPAEMVPSPRTSALQLCGEGSASPLSLQGTLGECVLLRRGAERELWDIEVLSTALAAFQKTYYVGWVARVDGVERPVQPIDGLGLVGLWLDPGEHRVELIYRGTRTQSYAEWTSLAGLLVILALVLAPALRSRRNRRTALVSVGAVLVLVVWRALAPAQEPMSAGGQRGPLIMDFARAPYLHTEPGGIRFGESVLATYRYEPEGESFRERLTVTLVWDRTVPGTTVEMKLVGATAHLYEPSPVWARASAPQIRGDDLSQALVLDLPADLPPGLYVPYLRVLHDGQEEPAATALGVSMGALALEPIRVAGGARRTGGDATTLGCYGPEDLPPVICLESVSAVRVDAEHLDVALVWRSEGQAPLNYELSLRLIGADGRRITSRDLPPLLGGYPTSLWRPGETITDRVILTVPPDLVASSLSVEVVLYNRADLKGAGTVTVPLTLPD